MKSPSLFRFRRYRQEVIRRQKEQGQTNGSNFVAACGDADNCENDAKTEQITTQKRLEDDEQTAPSPSCCLENLSNASITIEKNGRVLITLQDDEKIEQNLAMDNTFLVRNLEKCHVIMYVSASAVSK
jgi:hypothetical protein